MPITQHRRASGATRQRIGGAVVTHVRIGDPLFSHVLFPVYIGVMLWGGLYLRDVLLRALIPFRGTNA